MLACLSSFPPSTISFKILPSQFSLSCSSNFIFPVCLASILVGVYPQPIPLRQTPTRYVPSRKCWRIMQSLILETSIFFLYFLCLIALPLSSSFPKLPHKYSFPQEHFIVCGIPTERARNLPFGSAHPLKTEAGAI